MDTGILQGSPVAPILFITYLCGIFDKVVQGIQGLSFADDMIGWLVEGANGDQQRTGSGGSDCGCSACSGGAAGAGRNGVTRRNSSGTRGAPACSGFRCEIGVNVSAGVVVPDSFSEKHYTSPGLARGARRMRSYVIWLATGPCLCSSWVAQ